MEIKQMQTLLRQRFTKTNWDGLIYVKLGNDILFIEPCCDGDPCEKNTEYYLIEDNCGNLVRFSDGCNSIEELAEVLCNYDQLQAQQKAREDRIQAYFKKNIQGKIVSPTQWSDYSDWHKSVYGFRPHSHVCGTQDSAYVMNHPL